MKSDISGSVCFKRDDFHLYVFLLFVVIIYLLYILKNSKGYDVRKKESYTDVDLNSNLTKNELVNKINKLQIVLKLFLSSASAFSFPSCSK